MTDFPQNFVWGAATSSYQIEGGASADGKGESIWDWFCRKEGAVWGGHDGRVACDHYSRYRDDAALMKEMGLQAYRFSISWPRVLPEGVGKANQAGIDFYSRLVDALLERGIEPWVTLFHWDFPLELYRRGGWLNRDSAEWFGEFAAVVTAALSDRVTHYFTHNEPQVFLGHGHQGGHHAPGDTLPVSEVLRAGHHALLAHGKAVQALRAGAKRPLQLGYAPVGMAKYPASREATDVEAARKATFSITERDAWNNAWWMDPVILGRYPEQGLEFYGADAPEVRDGDLELICQPLEFLALNIYQGSPVRAAATPLGFERVDHPRHLPRTAFDWPVTPEALYWAPRFFFERYGLPIVISENGLSCRDWVSLDGGVHDPTRIDFAQRYLRELAKALADGVDVRAYFHWSVMDNFEWAAGYRERFGLVHVDFDTQRRTLKDSAHWYRSVIESNGAVLSRLPPLPRDETA